MTHTRGQPDTLDAPEKHEDVQLSLPNPRIAKSRACLEAVRMVQLDTWRAALRTADAVREAQRPESPPRACALTS